MTPISWRALSCAAVLTSSLALFAGLSPARAADQEPIKIGVISSARIYFSMLNWFGWDKYKGGVNPEAQNTNLTNATYPLPGDYGAMPLSKSAIFGVNIGL